MKKYQVDKDTVWIDTGKVIIHNYPPSPLTYAYAVRIYRQVDGVSDKEVEGPPIYLHEMTRSQAALAVIMASAQNALSNDLPNCNYNGKELKQAKAGS